MFPAPFEYFDPTSVEEAVDLLSRYGADARALAGGQTLVAAMNLGLVQPGVVVDLNRVAGLDHIGREDGLLRIGAMVRQRAVEGSTEVGAACPLLVEAAGLIGNARVRARGTIGGSLAHADPAAELPAAMLALEAEFRLVGPGGSRSVKAAEFFRGPLSTALADDELLVEVRLPLETAGGWAFEEVARRPGDFALVGAAVLVSLGEDGRVREARLAFAGSAAVRASAAEALPRDEEPTAELLADVAASAARALEVDSDPLASAAYRRHLARVVAGRALARAVERAQRLEHGTAERSGQGA